METPKHYDNSNGTLYKVAEERGWNAYIFDIVKRLERSEKKGEFVSDLNKSIDVIKLWLEEREGISDKDMHELISKVDFDSMWCKNKDCENLSETGFEICTMCSFKQDYE